jgi:hypothetical protein
MTGVLLLDGFLVVKYGNFQAWKNKRTLDHNQEVLLPAVKPGIVDFQVENTPKRITIKLEDGTKKRIKNPNYTSK